MAAGSRILGEQVGLDYSDFDLGFIAIDVLTALARPRQETIRIKSVVE
jgi:hypothetical protein